MNTLKLYAALGLAGFVAVYYLSRKAGQGAAVVGQAINPANPDNVVNQGVSAVVSAATGRDETLGGWLYDLTHADPLKLPATRTAPDRSDFIESPSYAWGA